MRYIMPHTRKYVVFLITVAWETCFCAEIHFSSTPFRGPFVGDWPHGKVICRPVPLSCIRVEGFLGKHIDANNRVSTDSDFYKWLEGACYAVAYDPGLGELKKRIGFYADVIYRLQRDDGYLGTGISPAGPFDGKVRHDLYVAGHFFEAAVAHWKATGSRKLLLTAERLADFYLEAFKGGHPYFKEIGRREHPEAELALVRLARATGEKRFLDFAADLTRMYRVGPTVAEVCAGGGCTHAVRFCYLLTGASELFVETGREEFRRNLLPLWEEVVLTRMYVTGGIGKSERIPLRPYDLPQCLSGPRRRDIAETCASVALMLFSRRLHALTGESRFFDVIERILYNHYLGALSPDHLANFYYNPLKRVGDLRGITDHDGDPVRRTRLPRIHTTACCLPNAWRFFGQLPEYVFSVRDDGFTVNLYTTAEAHDKLRDGTEVKLEMKTVYPAGGRIELRVFPSRPATFTIRLRIPEWCEGASVTLPGGGTEKAQAGSYHAVRRLWRPGDSLKLHLPMRPVALLSRPEIEANRGQVAFRYGPLVYCLEKQDSPGIDLGEAVVVLDRRDPSASARAVFDPRFGLNVLKVKVGRRRKRLPPREPYFPAPPLLPEEIRDVKLIPFFLRATRLPETRWITFIPYR